MHSYTHDALGTQLRVVSPRPIPGVGAAFAEADRIEQAFSRFVAGNELAELNAKIGHWHQVSPELFYLLQTGQELEQLSGGTFRLSVKSVLEGWGYDADYSLGTETDSGQVGSYALRPETHEVRLTAPLELGAIGKGYALTRMADMLADEPDLLINAGGDIYARGQADGAPWHIELEDPRDTSQSIGRVALAGGYLAGSSPVARTWRDRHHLVNAVTKEPARDMLACWVQAADGMRADGLCTVLFTAGYARAQQLAQQHQLATLLVGPGGEIWQSPTWQGELYTE